MMARLDPEFFTQETVEAIIDARIGRLVNAPPSGGRNGMEVRIAKLEASVEHIEREVSDMKSDIRDMRKQMWNQFIILAGMIIGLAGIMAKGFKWF